MRIYVLSHGKIKYSHTIATSPAVRGALRDNLSLRTLLQRIDGLKDEDREREIERLLGVIAQRQTDDSKGDYSERDTIKMLAKAVEEAIASGSSERTTGLDWLEN